MRAKASLSRFKDLFLIVARHASLHVLHQQTARWPRVARMVSGARLSAPKRFRLCIEELGGTFIKFGQMLAMQSDLLPLEYCAALFSLFDQVPPFDYTEVERTFLEDLQRTPQEIFDHFEIVPAATGSIGQVHVAMLQGQKVAVKVRRPSILSDFDADIAALRFTVRAVKLLRLRSFYWIVAPTEEFIAWTQEELDYRREAHYIDELGRNAKNSEQEKVPAVFWSCTTARILTVEFLEGITVSEYLRQVEAGKIPDASPDFDPAIYGTRLIDNFLGDAFRHGMFHADLHPGNLVIMPGNVVGYIDFGISGVLSQYSRRHLIAMTLAYARGDIEGMCEAFFRITTFDRNADARQFHRQLKELSSNWYSTDETESRLRKSITSIMLELLLLSKASGIWPQRDVIKYIRSAIALDGLMKVLSPGLDIGRQLEQACERHIKRDAMRSLISLDTLSSWFGGNARLFRDGFLRTFAMLRRAGAGLSAPAPFATRPQVQPQKHRAWPLQIMWIALCLAMIWQRQRLASLQLAVPLVLVLALIAWQALRHARVAGKET
ncbi:MAG TPA: AarF/UbiB family protein [Candidatus Angelobacter sp.]|nr:AarF/UbiB family protein [Candidatus Angelobacter sp.]